MKTAAIVPIKLNNSRLPGKNIKPFTNGEPLCRYLLNTLLKVQGLDDIYVYCSNPGITSYIPKGIHFLQRPADLDSGTITANDILQKFTDTICADIYIMAHITSPFLKAGTIQRGLDAVKSGEYDSAFSVRKIQDFLWRDGAPVNYDMNNIPRTQDLPAILEELTGFYVFNREVFTRLGRRIGTKPLMIEAGEIESIDIDEPEDFVIADAVFNYLRNSRGGGHK